MCIILSKTNLILQNTTAHKTRYMPIKIICPYTHEELFPTESGLVRSKNGQLKYVLKNGAYRVAPEENYTENFGLEWNTFQKTQIDKFNGTTISKNRFFSESRWPEDLSNENILEVGSGAGRFSQIVLDHTNANLYSVDYSDAVSANFKNNGPNSRLNLFQASIYELPFEKNSFDKVFCFGVLQHTPDFKKSVKCLINMVKPNGELVVDFYPIKGWYSKINAKYLLRPFTKKMSTEKLLTIIENNIDWLIKLYRFNQKIGLGFLNRFVPICDIDSTFPRSVSQIREWAILDTFDMYSPAYDNPQRLETVKAWFEELGLKNVKAEMIEYEKGLWVATVRGNKNNE